MKKMKRFFALFLAMAMVLGMSMTTFAAEAAPGTITVEHLKENTTLTYAHVIVPDTTSETGWAFYKENAEDTRVLDAYKTGFSNADEDTIIWRLIAFAEGKDKKVGTTTYTQATSKEIADSLNALPKTLFSSFANGSTVDAAGVYAIVASNTDYFYSRMAAYISFGYTNGAIDTDKLGTATIQAKGRPKEVTKKNNDEDKIVYVGQTLDYFIETPVPYLDGQYTSATYTITDTLTGGNYVLNDNDQLVVTIYRGAGISQANLPDKPDKTVLIDQVASVPTEPVDNYVVNGTNEGSFYLDLSSYAETQKPEDMVADENLVIKYSVLVTGTSVSNKVKPSYNDGEGKEKEDKTYTGSVTITKYDADPETNANANKLAGAQFYVYYTDDNNVQQYAKLVNNEVKSWLSKAEFDELTTEAKKDYMTSATANDGTVTVKGLDIETDYYFEEAVAPDGYSLNEKPSAVQWGDKPTAPNDTNVVGNATMVDTKLNSLPSTGGIGTTIFTVGGCAIMILAAGMFFVSRRRASR